MALEDRESQRQSAFSFSPSIPIIDVKGRLSGSWGTEGSRRWAGGNGGRTTAALVRMLIPLFTFPGQNPGMC